MKRWFHAVSTVILIMLGGCAAFGPPVGIGDSEADVIARLGTPTHRYADDSSRLLEYAHGPWGQTTYMARIGADGRLISYEQVLNDQTFSTIRIGETTRDQVLRIIGAPSEVAPLPLAGLEAWSYPYKESGVWNSVMHVQFDRSGIVRKMEKTPDWRFEPDSGFFGRM